jgi:hypothetical protein
VSDIFQEVEEDVRREHYEKLWKKYGNYVIAVASVLVLGVAGYQAWMRYDLSQRQALSDQYQAALQAAAAGDAVKAEQSFDTLAKNGKGGYATLAKFQLANAYVGQGKRDQAVALLKELAADADPLVSDPARLRLAWALADASTKAEVTATVQPLTAADSPWRFAAAEVLAYMDLKDGSRDAAIAAFGKLAQEQEASASLRQRAGALAEYLKANPPGGAAPAAAPAQGAKP